MKLSFAALTLAAMAGSTSALTFEPALAFTQFDGDCDGEAIYNGAIQSITTMSDSTFCVVDSITDIESGESMMSFSKVEIIGCKSDKIYEQWHHCVDSNCGLCETSHQMYSTWDSVNPDNLLGFCYDYTVALEDTATKAERGIATFDQVASVRFSFDDDVDAADAAAYIEMMDMNSCIKDGPPPASEDHDDEDHDDHDHDHDHDDEDHDDEMDSGASALATTAVVAMAAAATTMLL